MTTMSETDAAPTIRTRVRSIYRDGAGAIHLDWPTERIAEALADAEGILWVDIENPESDADRTIEVLLAETFRFHPLAIEDALKDSHVPRVDDWGEYLYASVQAIDFNPDSDDLQLHELDLFLGRNFLVTYHKVPMPSVEQHRENIKRDPEHRLRQGASLVLYHLLDRTIADYLPALEHLTEAIDDAQDEVFHRPSPATLQQIFRVKRAGLKLHRILVPERELLNRLARDDYAPISPEHRIYFRDVYDDVVRLHDIMEGLRDLVSGALDTYLSAVSNRTNEIMKVLTLVTVMFLPMSFVAGFFGMNFFGETLMFREPLPKQALFTITCSIIVLTPAAMYLYARRRGWL